MAIIIRPPIPAIATPERGIIHHMLDDIGNNKANVDTKITVNDNRLANKGKYFFLRNVLTMKIIRKAKRNILKMFLGIKFS